MANKINSAGGRNVNRAERDYSGLMTNDRKWRMYHGEVRGVKITAPQMRWLLTIAGKETQLDGYTYGCEPLKGLRKKNLIRGNVLTDLGRDIANDLIKEFEGAK